MFSNLFLCHTATGFIIVKFSYYNLQKIIQDSPDGIRADPHLKDCSLAIKGRALICRIKYVMT